MSLTVDANILVYASDRESPYHERAREEIERCSNGPEPLYLFWPVIVAYLRVSTHPSVFAQPLRLADASGEQLSNVVDRGLTMIRRRPSRPSSWSRRP